ncbi:VOC family protein [Nocardioides sp. NPDC051685]|uniref:VOC family protein n=1 Tax=Nocardioides sp. NPDC051685 TaxID=3364334 RepID=UPI00379F8DB0
MTIQIHHLTFDCTDARKLGEFWSALTGWHLFYDEDPEVIVAPSFPSTETSFLFIPVPEAKSAKNRMHIDIKPEDTTRDELVERALSLGATVYGDHRKEDGSGFVALRDPEGNEFCVERGEHEMAARGPMTIGLTI